MYSVYNMASVHVSINWLTNMRPYTTALSQSLSGYMVCCGCHNDWCGVKVFGELNPVKAYCCCGGDCENDDEL